MANFIDMTGWKMWEHGVPDSRLTVIERTDDYISPQGRHRIMWKCECNCQEHGVVITSTDQIKSGRTKSCGCLQRESLKYVHENNKKQCKYDVTSFYYGVGWTINTNREFYFDLEDYDKIKDYCWREEIDHTNYHFLGTNINHKHTIMSWLIVGKFYDHIDRNPFNNKKDNLRKSNSSENARNRTVPSNNTSGIIGVHWSKYYNAWVAQIGFEGRRIWLGKFTEKEEAIRTRLKAELKYFGNEFAPQRHLFKKYGIE